MKSSCHFLFNHLGLPTLQNSIQFSNSNSLISLASQSWSQSQTYFTTCGLPRISSSQCQAPWDPRPIFFQLNSCRAVAYCRQPASTVTLSIEPRWDPWPYICSVSRLLFFFLLSLFLLWQKGGVGPFYNWCSLATPYSTRGHIKVGDIYILYIFTKHKLTLKFYYIQGHLSMQDSAASYASTYLNLRNGS
jgi:hypothetical protein